MEMLRNWVGQFSSKVQLIPHFCAGLPTCLTGTFSFWPGGSIGFHQVCPWYSWQLAPTHFLYLLIIKNWLYCYLSVMNIVHRGESDAHSLGNFLEIKAGSQVDLGFVPAMWFLPDLGCCLPSFSSLSNPCYLAHWGPNVHWHLTYCDHRTGIEIICSHLLNFPFIQVSLPWFPSSFLVHTCGPNS